MPNIIKPKRTSTAGNTPTTANLASGELGVNMADQKTYINNGTSVVQIGAGNLTGLGDVVITSPTDSQALIYNAALGKWVNGTGGATTGVIVPNLTTAIANETLPNGSNGQSIGPIAINTGASITIGDNAQWFIFNY
jgi:hypothetical protein